jgi:hypothetical protein
MRGIVRCENKYEAMIEVKVDKDEGEGDFKKLESCNPEAIGVFLGLYWKGSYVMKVFQNGGIVYNRCDPVPENCDLTSSR